MDAMRLWGDGKMGKLRNIFGMNVGPEEAEAGTYEGALNIARKALNDMS